MNILEIIMKKYTIKVAHLINTRYDKVRNVIVTKFSRNSLINMHKEFRWLKITIESSQQKRS